MIDKNSLVEFSWGTGAPGTGLPADNFSVRFQRYLPFSTGFYRFTVEADDGVRLWVAGRLVVDRWDGPAGTHSVLLALPAGDQAVRLEYNDISGAASVQLDWWPWIPPYSQYLPLLLRRH